MNILEAIIKGLYHENGGSLEKLTQQLADDIREMAIKILFEKLGRLTTYEEYCAFVDKGRLVYKEENGKTTVNYQWDLVDD